MEEEEGFRILCLDEAAFYLLPTVVRTWAPRGRTLALRNYSRHDHLSTICAVSSTGDLHLRAQRKAFKSRGVIAFLEELMARISDRFLVLWDNIPIHRSMAVRDFVLDHSERMVAKYFPGYCSELNPAEGVWRHLKNVELRNVCCRDLTDLEGELAAAEARLRQQPDIIRSFYSQVGYSYSTCA
jgi:transposase